MWWTVTGRCDMLYDMEARKGEGLLTEAQKRAMRVYNKKTAQFVFRLRLDTDADVIDKLRKVGNRTEYIRKLVRRDIHGA